MSSDITVTLAPFQKTFVMSDERVVSIIAAKGVGKTWSGALYICREIADQPNGQGLVMFNTLQQARDIFAQDIEPRFKELNWPYNFNQQTLVCKVFDTLIHFRSAEPSALERIESVAYHWGWADEASYYSPDAFKTFFSRIRKGDARVRVTSMPDEPDHFMYSFLEGMEGTMFELSLADNPDRAFADRYEKFLRVTYSGAQLERYLSGKRVSLSGEGLFSVESHMRRPDIVYNPDEDVTLSWDFNVEYRAVSAWQVVGIAPDGNKILGCVRSWQMKGATVYEDAEALSDELRSHRARIILHGDASGESRSAQTTTSMWKTIRDVFNRKLENVRYIVPKSNPPVKDTIQCINWALRQGLVVFNDNERNVYMSLSACKADKYGEIDKSIDYTSNTTARSHEADTARYAVFETFKHVYPGNKGGFWIL
jgi:phage terminase large subunit-like protein